MTYDECTTDSGNIRFRDMARRSRRYAERIHADERGMLSMVNVVTVMLGVLLIIFVMNVGHVTYEKVEMQNAADAAAYTGALWEARGMNAITATNHVIGEMISLVIVHEAVGGKLLDEGGTAEQASGPLASKYLEFFPDDDYDLSKPSDLRKLNQTLDKAYGVVNGLSGVTPLSAYMTVREHRGVHAEATILDAKGRLKKLLIDVYKVKGVARGLQKIPLTYKIGVALEVGIHPFEEWIRAEYVILNAFESIAKGLTPLKEVLRDQMAPAAKQYTDLVAETVPVIAQQAARKVAELNETQGMLYPLVPELPIEIDPHAEAMTLLPPTDQPVSIPGREAGCCGCPSKRTTIDRDQIVKITQLARATFPWVVYHRQPVIDALRVVPLSQASGFYKDHTDGYSKDICDEVQRTTTSGRSVKIQLYVIKNGSAPDKGFEAWTDDPVKADRLFSTVGLVYRRPPKLIASGGVFRQQHVEGRLAYAQALLYNANAQVRPEHKIDLTCKRIVPNRQADVGWDTLNWKSGTRPTELAAVWDNGGAPPSVFPEIEVNWQAKLVPGSTTRLRELAQSPLPAPFHSLVAKMLPDAPAALQTH